MHSEQREEGQRIKVSLVYVASLGFQEKEGLAESGQDRGVTTSSEISRYPPQFCGCVEVITLWPIWEVHTGMAWMEDEAPASHCDLPPPRLWSAVPMGPATLHIPTLKRWPFLSGSIWHSVGPSTYVPTVPQFWLHPRHILAV